MRENAIKNKGIEAAAAALINQRVMRNGSPPISNILDLVRSKDPNKAEEALGDARAAVSAYMDAIVDSEEK